MYNIAGASLHIILQYSGLLSSLRLAIHFFFWAGFEIIFGWHVSYKKDHKNSQSVLFQTIYTGGIPVLSLLEFYTLVLCFGFNKNTKRASLSAKFGETRDFCGTRDFCENSIHKPQSLGFFRNSTLTQKQKQLSTHVK